MREDSFYLPEFKACEPAEKGLRPYDQRDFVPTPVIVKQARDDHKLTYNHYHYAKDNNKRVNVEVETGARMVGLSGLGNSRQTLDQKLINGYDGFSGVHDNLAWNPAGGLTYFTLNNKLIIEETQTRT